MDADDREKGTPPCFGKYGGYRVQCIAICPDVVTELACQREMARHDMEPREAMEEPE